MTNLQYVFGPARAVKDYLSDHGTVVTVEFMKIRCQGDTFFVGHIGDEQVANEDDFEEALDALCEAIRERAREAHDG